MRLRNSGFARHWRRFQQTFLCHRRKPGRKAVPKFRPGVSAAFRTAEKPSTRYPGIKHPI